MAAARDLFRDSQTSCERKLQRIGNIWCPGSLFSHCFFQLELKAADERFFKCLVFA